MGRADTAPATVMDRTRRVGSRRYRSLSLLLSLKFNVTTCCDGYAVTSLKLRLWLLFSTFKSNDLALISRPLVHGCQGVIPINTLVLIWVVTYARHSCLAYYRICLVHWVGPNSDCLDESWSCPCHLTSCAWLPRGHPHKYACSYDFWVVTYARRSCLAYYHVCLDLLCIGSDRILIVSMSHDLALVSRLLVHDCQGVIPINMLVLMTFELSPMWDVHVLCTVMSV